MGTRPIGDLAYRTARRAGGCGSKYNVTNAARPGSLDHIDEQVFVPAPPDSLEVWLDFREDR